MADTTKAPAVGSVGYDGTGYVLIVDENEDGSHEVAPLRTVATHGAIFASREAHDKETTKAADEG